MRVTTNSVLKSYRKSLSTSFSKLTDARNTVLTQRNFNSYAEDPASATQAFKLRRSFLRTNDQLNNTESIINKFGTAYQVLDNISDLANESNTAVLRAINDPTGSGRNALGQTLLATSDSMLQLMNSKYGDSFVFAGNDGLHVPFSWKESYQVDENNVYLDKYGEKLTHTTTSKINDDFLQYLQDRDPAAFPNTGAYDKVMESIQSNALQNPDGSYVKDVDGNYLDKSGNVLTFTEDNDITEAYVNALEEPTKTNINAYVKQNAFVVKEVLYRQTDITDDANESLVNHFTGESAFMDIGMGLKDNELGELNELSAFNSALCGLNFIGHGKDEDGDSQNMVSIVQELGEIFSRCDIDSGEWANEGDAARATELQLKLYNAMGELTSATTDLSTQASFLNTNAEQLTDAATLLNEQIVNIEDCDLADAITTFSWAQYCYNAALKIGNSVLSESLMDYMN